MRPPALSAVVALAALAGCSRATESPQPKVIAEAPRDAGVVRATPLAPASTDAGAPRAEATGASPLSIVARAPMPTGLAAGVLADTLGSALPLVQRLPGGGLVVAAEHARARADGPGALNVELLGAGFEASVLAQHVYVNQTAALRWVWAGAEATVVVDESDTSRIGPSLHTFKLGPAGFERLASNTGYWSAVLRGGTLLALERTTRATGPGGVAGTMRTLQRSRVVVLAGKDAAPALPQGFCPHAMSAAPDGSLAVVGEACDASQPAIVRFAPGDRQGKREALGERSDGAPRGPLVVLAASADEIYVADEDALMRWDGKAWSASRPFAGEAIVSLSRAPSSELWAVTQRRGPTVAGRLARREGSAWRDVPLPKAPADALDDEVYSDVVNHFAFTRGGEAYKGVLERKVGSDGPLVPWRVDARGDEVLVLASESDEAFVLSTRPRAPVARLPSPSLQRARLARSVKRRAVTSPKLCEDPSRTTLVFAEGAALGALQRALAAGEPLTIEIEQGVVEGRAQPVGFGFDPDAMIAAKKRLATFGPRHLCGPPVLDEPRP